MSESTTTNFELPQYGYLSFDPITMKSLIKERLTKSGIFTEQIIEGSYVSQLIDIFAYVFHTLIYYMSRTAAEGSFVDTTSFENINRIVKALGYNPIGAQTSTTMFKAKYTNGPDEYSNSTLIIPRYSFVSVAGTKYSLHDDLTFVPNSVDDNGWLINLAGKNILYQGEVKQADVMTAEGSDNEIFYLNEGENLFVDYFTIDVYVKHDAATDKNAKWEKWESTPSLYLNNADDNVYEIRLNEKNYYELKFGNDICGKKLSNGDQIAVFYIQSGGDFKEIGSEALQNGTFSRFSNDLYDEIMADVRGDLETQVISYQNIKYFKVFNPAASTSFSYPETAEEIKENTPGIFRTQYRLVTTGDFENYVKTNFSTLIHDVKVMNNWTYLATYMKYYYNLGLTVPTANTPTVLNQVLFSDACNFNNVYVISVPKISTQADQDVSYVPSALKTNILQSLSRVKVLTCEPIMMDPIYMAFALCCPENKDELTLADVNSTTLHVTVSTSSKINPNLIKTKVAMAIADYFAKKNCKLGQQISLLQLQSDLLSIDGVSAIHTQNESGIKMSGLSFVKFNEMYPTNISQVVQDEKLEDFQFPYLYHASTISEKIVVDDITTNVVTMEY